jgi:hypothetical protein
MNESDYPNVTRFNKLMHTIVDWIMIKLAVTEPAYKR